MSLTPLFGVRPKSAGNFPPGTKMLFQQSTAPVGWVKQTTHNDKALRVVSGTAGSGGGTGFTSVFGAGKNTGNTSSGNDAHVHQVIVTTNATGGTSAGLVTANRNHSNTGSSGSGSSHNHALTMDITYVDIIIASKS